MSSQPYSFDDTEAYLFGHMPPEDKAAFEAAIRENPELSQQVEQHRLEHEAMALLLKNDFRQQLQSWRTEKEAGQSAPDAIGRKGSMSFFTSRILPLAAAACALLLVGYFAFQWLQAPDYPRLAAHYFEQSAPTVRGSGDDAYADMPAGLQDALRHMKESEYQNALTLLENTPDNGYRELRGLLLIECLFQLGRFDDALQHCRKLEDDPASQPDTREKSEWYTILCLLGKEDTGTAFQERLKAIANDPEHSFYLQAKKLMGEIE